MLLDFPLNRVVLGNVTVVHLLTPPESYVLQAILLLTGLLFTLDAAHRISRRVFPSQEAALASFIPIAGLAVVLTLIGVWTLGTGLL